MNDGEDVCGGSDVSRLVHQRPLFIADFEMNRQPSGDPVSADES